MAICLALCLPPADPSVSASLPPTVQSVTTTLLLFDNIPTSPASPSSENSCVLVVTTPDYKQETHSNNPILPTLPQSSPY
jgi:hypothetical protein